MKPFNYDGYMKNNPLLQETDGYGNYKNPEAMLEDQDPYTYQSAEEFDIEPQDGPNDPLGPDEELMESSSEVIQAYTAILEKMRHAIKQFELSSDDVVELRVKLAEFFK